MEQAQMPVARYFFFVGGALLALLLLLDAVLPKSPVGDSTAALDPPVIRIQSDRKWPERVVFDTSIPTIVPVQTAKTDAVVPVPPTTVADVSAKARVREAFAQFKPADEKKPELKRQQKRKIAKRHVPPPTVLVAQQPRFGFFDNATW
jgi:hypothetical protein